MLIKGLFCSKDLVFCVSIDTALMKVVKSLMFFYEFSMDRFLITENTFLNLL